MRRRARVASGVGERRSVQRDEIVTDERFIGQGLFARGTLDCPQLWGQNDELGSVLSGGSFYLPIGDSLAVDTGL